MDKFLSGFDIPPSASQSILDDWESSGEKTVSDNEDKQSETVTDQISPSTPEKSPVIKRKRKCVFTVSSPIIASSRRRPATSPIISSRKKICGDEASTPKSSSLSRKRKLILDEVNVNSTPPVTVGPISSAWRTRSIVKVGEVVGEKKKPGGIYGVKKFIENLLASSQELFPDQGEDETKDIEAVTQKFVGAPDPSEGISGIKWLSSVGEDLNSSDNIDITLCNSQEARRPAGANKDQNCPYYLDKNSETFTETIGSDGDVNINKNIFGSKWLSDIRSQSTSGSHTSESPGPSQEALADLTVCSAKKKKPVKKGLLAKLERTLKGVESGRALKNHLLRNLATESGDRDLELTILSSRSANGVQVVRCQTSDSKQLVLLINEEFGLVEGEALSISPPWCSFSLPHNSTQVLVGVTKWQTLERTHQPATSYPPPHPPLTKTVSMICKCQTREKQGGPCEADDECHGLMSLLALPCPPELNTTPNMVNVVQGKEVLPGSMAGSPKSVLDMVDNMGGCSGSPQTNPRRPTRLQLIIHRVLTRVKQSLNETLNATLACWSGSDSVDVSLLCEDPVGDFTLVKLDGELRNNPLWSSLFSDGEEWEGSRVKMVGLYPQDRLTANRHGRLFGVVKSTKQTQQRFLYVLRAYGESKIEKLETDVCQPTLCRLSEAAGRCNVTATVLYRTTEYIYVTDESIKDSTVNYIKVSYSSSCLFPEEMGHQQKPLAVLILGLSLDIHGGHSLDCYSSIRVRLAPSLDLTLISPPVWSGVALEGDLVTVGGRVAAVDEDRSVEWLICGVCGREDLEEIVDEGGGVAHSCGGCRRSVEPLERMTLVCRIIAEAGLVWIQLKDELAKKVLSSVEEGEDIIAEDVVGKQVEKVVCIFQGGILCQA